MADFLITYIEPTADERDFARSDVRFLGGKGLVTFIGSFCVVFDNSRAKYFSATRILQIDVRLSASEEQDTIRNNRNAKRAVVYYHKIEIDKETQYVKKIRCIAANDRPYGFECFIESIGDHFTKVIIPSFKEIVYIPTQKIIGIDEESG